LRLNPIKNDGCPDASQSKEANPYELRANNVKSNLKLDKSSSNKSKITEVDE
jgi:hypothetical protein